MKLAFREGLVSAKHEMQAVYPAPITSHAPHDKLKTRSQSSYVCLQRGFFFCLWYWLHTWTSILQKNHKRNGTSMQGQYLFGLQVKVETEVDI